MKVLSENIIVKCLECGKQYKIDTDYLDEEVCSMGEGGMGERSLHSFIHVMDCDCGNEMRIIYEVQEYPINCLDYEKDGSEGCSIISGFSADFDDEYLEELIPIYYQILENPNEMHSLTSREFEEFVADIFYRHGYNVQVTKATRDGGKDIIATCSVGGVKYTTYFECKKYSVNNPVDVDIVRSLYAVLEKDRIEKGVIVTTSRFTRDAINEAKQFNGRIQLIDYEELVKLIRE